ncbi:MAG: caspase family protein, partial [Rhodospirillales bacterium]
MTFPTEAKVDSAAVKRFATFSALAVVGFLASCATPPPPMIPAYDPQSAVEICADGECGRAGERFALDDIAQAIAEMFKTNGPGFWDFCVADRDDRRCLEDQLSYTINGVIPATGFVPGGALRAGARHDGKRGVSFRVNIPTIVFDTPSVCDDARSTLSVRSSNNILWTSSPYMCSWGGGPKNIKAEGRYGIDYIDFDRAVMGGEFIIRVSEGGNGFTRGYAVTRLPTGMEEVQEVWLRSRGVRPKTVAAPSVPSFSQPPEAAPQAAATPVFPSTAPVRFPQSPIDVTFKRAAPRPDDIAVIIGNADYSKYGNDIPNVVPAYADAEGFKRYVIQALGVREGNIVDLRDASQADMISVFGASGNFKGRLFNWVKPGRSKVTIYYSGHGAPAGGDGSPYLVPVDANPATIDLNGYPLKVLYANLAKVPAKSITVVLEACFSGAAEGGSVISNASPVYMKPQTLSIPANVTVIAAGGAREIASWEKDKSHGLFTK